MKVGNKRILTLVLKVGGAVLAAVCALVLLLFLGGSLVEPALASMAPRPLEAWRFVEEKGVRIADHSEAFKAFNITSYEGSKTCLPCHEEEVRDVVSSIHYRMAAEVNDVEGYGSLLLGSRMVYNDFCGAIFWNGTVPVNFIGKAVLKRAPEGKEELVGRLIATGCSMCHGVSLGKPPSIEPGPDDLENVDCLVCHSTVYKGGAKGVKEGWRQVYRTSEGWRYRPNAKGVPVEVLAKTIAAKPPKEQCLWCHGFSGGGPGFKRPNLSPDLLGNVSEEFDVHMARGLVCVDCHRFNHHRVDTSGALDTWAHTGSSKTMSCSDCHPEGERHRAPLIGFIVEAFHERVACQTCHIPLIAHGKYPTDVYRDWSHVEFNEKLGRWEPHIELRGNVTPTYMWWNGRTRVAYVYQQPVKPVNGTIELVKPVGSIEEPESKIYPFKFHIAVVPFDEEKGVPVPIKVGIVFATGNLTKAIEAGASVAGLQFKGKFVKLVRYMSVDHGVKPKEEALRCVDCHSPWGRMPWDRLGFGALPYVVYLGTPVGLVLGLALLVAGYVIERRGG